MNSKSSFLLAGLQLILFLALSIDSQVIDTSVDQNVKYDANYFLNFDFDSIPKYNLSESSYYIAGGTNASFEEFLSMAALGWKDDSGKGGIKFHGGGTLISPKMVLTAAHCAYKNGKLPDIVFIGGYPLSEFEAESFYPRAFSVVNVTIFPKYDPNQAYHDIAILQLNDTAFAPPICLWNSENLISDNVTAIGYGLQEFAGMSSENLLKVNLTVFPADTCKPYFKRQRKFRSGISKHHICAGDKEGIKDTCQGDSGGPLIARHRDMMFAVGITSSGQACSGFPPAIYTKIYSYREWITKVLDEHGQSMKDCDN